MKLIIDSDLFSLSLSRGLAPLKLKTDNPGGSWLREEQEFNVSKGLNKHGAPMRFGAVTGSWSREVLLPIDVLAAIKGTSGEQSNVRSDSIDWLTKHMAKHKRLPLFEGRHYKPYIVVWQDGTPWVNEGNHRIMVAKASGFKYLPVRLIYCSGGETKTNGKLAPAEVRMYDSDAQAAGFTLTNYMGSK